MSNIYYISKIFMNISVADEMVERLIKISNFKQKNLRFMVYLFVVSSTYMSMGMYIEYLFLC